METSIAELKKAIQTLIDNRHTPNQHRASYNMTLNRRGENRGS
ncbi:18132_t:CDS:1, partial [Dentiscutata erythropus]